MKIKYIKTYYKKDVETVNGVKDNKRFLYAVEGTEKEIAAYAENSSSEPLADGRPTFHRKTFFGIERDVTISEDGKNVNLLPTDTELMEDQLKGMAEGDVKKALASQIATARFQEMLANNKILRAEATEADTKADLGGL